MDEENKQVTADEVYSYGESTEEPAGEPEATGSEDSQDNKFVYQDNQYDYSSSTAGTEMSSQTTLQWI